MANDADWVEDVRRWYFGGNAPAADAELASQAPVVGDPVEVGYETAHPALQARHWPDAPRPQIKNVP